MLFGAVVVLFGVLRFVLAMVGVVARVVIKIKIDITNGLAFGYFNGFGFFCFKNSGFVFNERVGLYFYDKRVASPFPLW
ncbi:hypothetical protein BSPWISOXPB_6188 [uncultured Gammaproteobacteria bacterium]|nr:hypothetical protein BSPWISOXPB_6188 [uncultured Gammaproteobacteria bacterium]